MPTDYTYTGQRSEMDSIGLLFYNARWLDPLTGRFAQADSIVPGVGSSQAWDRYAYAMNNTLRYVDPSGHRPCDEENGCDGDKTRTSSLGPDKSDSKSKPLCEVMTSQANCQKMSKVASVGVFALDTGSLALSSIGIVIELIGLLEGPIGEGGAITAYQALNAFEGNLGFASSTITALNDFLITGDSYFTADPQPQLVLGSDTTISVTMAIVGGLDPEAASDTLLNSAVWANDLYRLSGGEGFLQTHIGLTGFYLTFGKP